MSKARPNYRSTLRFTSVLVVLLGATTFMGACSSGDVSGSASVTSDTTGSVASSNEDVATAVQALNWPGGCACIPETECATGTIGNPCMHVPVRETCPKLLCGRSEVMCYIEPDKTSCGLKIGSTCDGGYCGQCPTCYMKNGLCAEKVTLTTCGVMGGACRNCNDGNSCTQDACQSGSCSNDVLGDGKECLDGSGLCYSGVCCSGCMFKGACVNGTDPVACGTKGAECKTCPTPTNPCMRAICKDGGCGEEPWPQGTSCADSTICNGNETCDGAGNCLKGTDLDCRTGDPCFLGSCDPTQGCIKSPAPNTTPCSDGNECTVADRCNETGLCVPGQAKNCNDNKVCTKDECDTATGACVNSNLPNDSECDDGAACTSGDKCVDGACVGGGLNCDDGRYCTQDSVDCSVPSDPKCVNDATPRSGLLCPPTDKCVSLGTCVVAECVPTEGSRVNCDDGNPCTVDSCDSSRGCVRTNADVTTSCNDSNPCTVADHCDPSNGRCVGVPNPCPPSDDCHQRGSCDEVTGKCGTGLPRIDGAPCMSGTGQCVAGVCKVLATGTAGAAGALGTAGFAGEPGNAGTAGTGTEAGGSGAIPNTAVTALGGQTGTSTVATGGSTASEPGTQGTNPSTTIDPGDLYKPNPGGCGCAVPRSSSNLGLAWIGFLGLAAARLRKPRR